MFISAGEIHPYVWIPVILILILTIVFIYRSFSRYINRSRTRKSAEDELYEIIESAGYSYDPVQEIFYSNMYSWQRDMGYCRLYDEASAPLNMIIDCEPIYFEYGNKRWMIEFWKGQYGMTAGGEIGVYTTEGPDLSIPGIFNGTCTFPTPL